MQGRLWLSWEAQEHPKRVPGASKIHCEDSVCSLCQPQVALQELGLGRELLLLSVTTGHNLHMHSVDATNKHKIIESSDRKKSPKFIAE